MKIPALVLMLALGAPLAAGAADTPPAMTDAMHPAMDCGTANATMMSMTAKPGAMPAMNASGGLDENFATSMHAMSAHAMDMAKLEATCGKDPKTRALARKMLEDLQDFAQRLQMREREGY